MQAMKPYEGVAVPESEHIEQNAEQLEQAFRWGLGWQFEGGVWLSQPS